MPGDDIVASIEDHKISTGADSNPYHSEKTAGINPLKEMGRDGRKRTEEEERGGKEGDKEVEEEEGKMGKKE